MTRVMVAATLGPMDYVKMAEDLSRRVGTPFGPLPADLLGPRKGRPEEVVWATFAATPSFTDDFGAGGGTRTPDLARMKRPL